LALSRDELSTVGGAPRVEKSSYGKELTPLLSARAPARQRRVVAKKTPAADLNQPQVLNFKPTIVRLDSSKG
jgi:hypothetical protein